jgi:putative membrane protein
MVMQRQLSEEDFHRVSEAVAKAERESDGEIVTIVSRRSDAYHDAALHYAVLAMLFVPIWWAAIPQAWVDWITGIALGWNAEPGRQLIMLYMFAKMAGTFLFVLLLLRYRPLRVRLTPGGTKTRRVHRRAVELFRATCELRTRGRTGVLIYLSMEERRAEIVADRAITEKVEPEVWGEAMALLVDEVKQGRPGAGLVLAVEKVGAVLATILPPRPHNPDELPNRVVIL